MNQKGIGVSNLPNLKYKSICKNGIDFNIMTVGSHGLGKTSFINGLLSTVILQDTMENSDFHVTTCTVVENEFKTNMTITEIDRLGDSDDNDKCWVHIVKYLHESYQDYLNKEQKNVRTLIRDKRVHVCFYFLEPNVDFIKPADLLSMKEISKYCNLIPIVSKSDFLNERQIQDCFDFLRNVIESNGITVFEENNPTRGDITSFIPPFFVVCPDKHGSMTRNYQWGSIDIGNLVTNDLFRLRDKLINKNIIDLIERTEEFYDKFRATVLSNIINKQASKNLNKDISNMQFFEDMSTEEKTLKDLRQRIIEKKNKMNK
ncbi:hypothetical protein P3W45_001515 [Vairimorpha bombi]|jgi:septin 7